MTMIPPSLKCKGILRQYAQEAIDMTALQDTETQLDYLYRWAVNTKRRLKGLEHIEQVTPALLTRTFKPIDALLKPLTTTYLPAHRWQKLDRPEIWQHQDVIVVHDTQHSKQIRRILSYNRRTNNVLVRRPCNLRATVIFVGSDHKEYSLSPDIIPIVMLSHPDMERLSQVPMAEFWAELPIDEAELPELTEPKDILGDLVVRWIDERVVHPAKHRNRKHYSTKSAGDPPRTRLADLKRDFEAWVLQEGYEHTEAPQGFRGALERIKGIKASKQNDGTLYYTGLAIRKEQKE